ncbi:hypothetical protein B5808_19380 (plasmid) [Cnuibacter physcomitrellae]|uniref:Uncharacterized protein n=1 Tax=Cnuibacter physcomitrellae TaxID=1619308 RepID=A0A1X9LT14_9MICO|nr:hypothetical protein B5808_19380 [Cnuibacter physcomitrellae]
MRTRRALSALVRRIGLLDSFAPFDVDCWGWLGGSAAVEAYCGRLDSQILQEYMRLMTSQDCEPHLVLRSLEFLGDSADIVFSSGGINRFLNVRLRRRSRENPNGQNESP